MSALHHGTAPGGAPADRRAAARHDGAPGPISVVLADAHATMRRSLRRVLDRDPEIRVVGECIDCAETADAVMATHPDVVVLDLTASSIALIRALTDAGSSTHVVAVSLEKSPGVAGAVMAAGASAFVLKDAADEELLAAVHSAAADHATSHRTGAPAPSPQADAPQAVAPSDPGTVLPPPVTRRTP